MSLLCIGGLDPLGRAGLLADRQACQAFGVEAQVVCSALTAQDDASGAVYPVDPAFFAEQLRVVLRAARPQVVKVGWLSDEAQVTELLRQVGDEVELIIDPLLRTSSGVRVYESDWSAPSYARLLARADLLTPNLVEARELVGGTTLDPVELGSRLQQLGARRVLVKGGHGEGDVLEDVLIDRDGGPHFYRHPRVPGHHRGTGCRLASACGARRSQGATYIQAVTDAVRWLEREIQAAAAAF